MATKAAAFHSWLESTLGIACYAASSVPDDAEMPYATYEWADGAVDDGDVPIALDIWHRTESEAAPNRSVEKLAKSLELSGRTLRCDDGMLWVKRGSPFAQAVPDDDNSVKRRYVNLLIEFLTPY